MASTYSLAAVALETIVNVTFDDVTAKHDKVHESLGFDGPVCGISPINEVPYERNRAAMQTYVEIRYFGRWDKRVDPTQSVDPRVVSDKADELQDAIRTAEVVKSGDLWFFNVERIEYPDDPTGNKTRFIMTVKVWANNSTLVETTA